MKSISMPREEEENQKHEELIKNQRKRKLKLMENLTRGREVSFLFRMFSHK